MSGQAQALREKASALGFADCRITSPGAIPRAGGRLAQFLAEGHHADMGWMAERTQWRGDPAALWPAARSVIMLADAYPDGDDALERLSARDRGNISAYARNRDYHDIVKKRLRQLGRWLIDRVPETEIKVFVDTAPVMEKPLAAAAGIGWQGKHTNLVGRNLGSWFFLGAIFTTLELPVDAPEVDHCGSCRRCLDICPTEAFPAPYRLDARRCISYLTIEHKGPVDAGLRPALGNRIYGCDDCLAVCPWNKFAVRASQSGYMGRADLSAPALAALAELDDAAFRERFAGSPIKRIGRNRMVRNVAYAIGNSGDTRLAPVARRLAGDTDAVVADAGAWAAARLDRAR